MNLPPKLISKLDAMCSESGHNIKRAGMIEWACEWYAAAYEANGRRLLTKRAMQGLIADVDEKSNYVIQMGPKAHEILSRVAARVLPDVVDPDNAATTLAKLLVLHALCDLENSIKKVEVTERYVEAEGITDKYEFLEDQAECKSGKVLRKYRREIPR